jgi:hypothetical protein
VNILNEALSGIRTRFKGREMPSVLERYEMKYLIPVSMIDDIIGFVRPYCEFDAYSTIEKEGFYVINSLYFDTPSFLFLRQRLNKVENRFNMRIRSYGENPKPPYFLEIKQRKSDIVRKFRAPAYQADVGKLFSSPAASDAGEENVQQNANRDLFLRLAAMYGARPVVLLQYRRKALFSMHDEYARVTFDIALRYMTPEAFSVMPRESTMHPCDTESDPNTGAMTILELKCYTTHVPIWMVDLIRAFQLKRRGFSKYATCVSPLIARHNAGAMLHSLGDRLYTGEDID